MRLPVGLKVNFVGDESSCGLLEALVGSPFIGIDSEWRPQMTKFTKLCPALLQLCDGKQAFLVDLVSLADN